MANSTTTENFPEDDAEEDEEASTGNTGDEMDDNEGDLYVIVGEPHGRKTVVASGGVSDATLPAEAASTITFSAYEVAQAFSHFSYAISGRKRLICDIQGVHDKQANLMKISDPVVHYYNRRKEHRRCVHGHTDLGLEGMQKFFSTHECSELCKLVVHGLRTPSSVDRYRKKRAYDTECTSSDFERAEKKPRLTQLVYQD